MTEKYIKYLIYKIADQSQLKRLKVLESQKNDILNRYLSEVFILKKLIFKVDWSVFFTLNCKDQLKNDLIKKNLNKFLNFLEKKKIIYFYVAELSEENKHKHFHFVINKFIDVNELSQIWDKTVGSVDDIKKIFDLYGIFIYMMKSFEDSKVKLVQKELNLQYLFKTNYVEIKEDKNKLIDYEYFLEDLARGYVTNNDELCQNFEKKIQKSSYNMLYKICQSEVKKNNDLLFDLLDKVRSGESSVNRQKIKFILSKIKKDFLSKIHLSILFLIVRMGSSNYIKKHLFFCKIGNIVFEFSNSDLDSIDNDVSIKKSKNEIKILKKEYDEEEEKTAIILGLHFFHLFVDKIYNNYFNYEINLESLKLIYLDEFLKKFDKNELENLIKGSIDYRNLMVVKPIDWSEKVKGGYLKNKYLLYFPIPDNKIRFSNLSYEIINKLQNQPLKINWDYLDFINKNISYFLEYSNKDEIETKQKVQLLIERIKELNKQGKEIVKNACLNLKEDFKKLSKTKYKSLLYQYTSDKNRSMYKEILSELKKIKSKLSEVDKYNRIIVPLINNYKNIENVYFPYNFDFRGRVYPYNTEINHINGLLYRSLFLSKDEEILDINILRIYISRCYFKNKLLNKLELKRFFEIENEVINFRNLKIFKTEKNNNCGLLAGCLEYEKYLNFIKKNSNLNYKSNFLISVDAHCSGTQLLGLLLRDYSALKALNLIMDNKTKRLNDFYLYIIELYLNFLNTVDCSKEEFKKYELSKNLYKEYYSELFEFSDENKIKLRQLFKKSIMTFAYGLSIDTYLKEIKETFSSLYENKYGNQVLAIFENVRQVFIDFYSYYKKNVKLGTFYSYLQEFVECFNKNDKGIKYQTITGSSLTHRYVKEFSKKIDLRIAVFKKLQVLINSDKKLPLKKIPSTINLNFFDYDLIDTSKQKTAFCANFIHSIDSGLLLSVLKKLFDLNIFCLPIHDCFLIHPKNYDFLLSQYNLKLVELFLEEDDYLVTFLDELKKQLNNSSKSKKIYSEILELRSIISEDEFKKFKNMILEAQYSLLISGG
jgi:hypothetical protein